jgi:hypothetical protein
VAAACDALAAAPEAGFQRFSRIGGADQQRPWCPETIWKMPRPGEERLLRRPSSARFRQTVTLAVSIRFFVALF